MANKNFNVLWNDARKTSDCFKKYVKTITEHHKGSKLEITDAAERCICGHGTMYRICNHSTGKIHDFFMPYVCGITSSGQLESMLWALICDSEFWGEKIYNSSLFCAASQYKNSSISINELRDLLTDECYGLSDVINTKDKEERINEFKSYLSKNDSSKINDFLKENCDELVTAIHKKEWGWKHGKDKKALMMPLIEYVEQQAKEKGIAENKISEFKEKCLKELDAPFRTNKKTIINAFMEVLNKFENTPSKCSDIDRILPAESVVRDNQFVNDASYDEWLPW